MGLRLIYSLLRSGLTCPPSGSVLLPFLFVRLVSTRRLVSGTDELDGPGPVATESQPTRVGEDRKTFPRVYVPSLLIPVSLGSGSSRTSRPDFIFSYDQV